MKEITAGGEAKLTIGNQWAGFSDAQLGVMLGSLSLMTETLERAMTSDANKRDFETAQSLCLEACDEYERRGLPFE